MENIELSDGSFVAYQDVGAHEFTELAKASAGPVLKFKHEFDVDVYILDNKEVIAHNNGYYMQFRDIGDLEKVLMDSAANSQGVEILRGKNPFGSDFPSHAPQLVKELADMLKVNYTEPDKKFLSILDSRLEQLPNSSEFKKKHLISLIAVVGETLKKNRQTEWEMILSSDTQTWNPYLRAKQRPVEFFTFLYEDIYINNRHEKLLENIYETMYDIISPR